MNRVNVPDAKLSEHFRLYEFLRSDTAAALGIDNTPSPAIEAALAALAERMEIVRAALGGHRIDISSGYRCLALNRALKSKDTSDHVKGLACDFTAPTYGAPPYICHRLVSSEIRFKQLILEGPGRKADGKLVIWVHISFDLQGELAGNPPKRQVLTIAKSGTVVGIREDLLA